MKNLFILVLIFIAPVLVNAQANVTCDKPCCGKTEKKKVQKGYYAIGNNSQKLAGNKKACCNTPAVANQPVAQQTKGYYAIGDNQKRLQPASRTSGEPTKQRVAKGYYAIGNNSDKLGDANTFNVCCNQCPVQTTMPVN